MECRRAVATNGRTYALFDDAAFPSAEDIAKGWQVAVSRAPLGVELGGWKTGNYWSRVQAFALKPVDRAATKPLFSIRRVRSWEPPWPMFFW